MKNLRIAERLFNTPLMISEDKLNVILHVLGPRFNLDLNSLPKQEAREVSEQERRRAGYRVQSGVGIIPIHGTLVQRAGWLDAESGITSYEAIRRAFDMALKDDSVREIVFDCDSPGGEVNGCFDLADHIYASRSVKPSTALVNEQAYSACYLLASAAGRVIITRTGGAGSIGVIATHISQAGWNEKTGLAVTHVFAGARKADFSPHSELSKEALDVLQGMVGDTYEMLVDAVARYRNMTKQQVIETEAGLFVGKKALAAGLADEVSAVDKALGKIAARTKTGTARQVSAAARKESQTMNVEELRQNHPDLVSQIEADARQGMIAQAAHDEALQVARQEGTTKAQADATAAERARILAVHAACQANNAGPMFARLVEDGCNEQQANGRILDAIAMRNEDNDVSSRHSGGPANAKAAIDYKAAYENVK